MPISFVRQLVTFFPLDVKNCDVHKQGFVELATCKNSMIIDDSVDLFPIKVRINSEGKMKFSCLFLAGTIRFKQVWAICVDFWSTAIRDHTADDQTWRWRNVHHTDEWHRYNGRHRDQNHASNCKTIEFHTRLLVWSFVIHMIEATCICI